MQRLKFAFVLLVLLLSSTSFATPPAPIDGQNSGIIGATCRISRTYPNARPSETRLSVAVRFPSGHNQRSARHHAFRNTQSSFSLNVSKEPDSDQLCSVVGIVDATNHARWKTNQQTFCQTVGEVGVTSETYPSRQSRHFRFSVAEENLNVNAHCWLFRTLHVSEERIRDAEDDGSEFSEGR